MELSGPLAALSWLTSDQGLMALLGRNPILGLAIVAGVVFCETGLVILPFLPGDSLLFATGTYLGLADVSPFPAVLVIALAAILGDGTNYLVGRSALGAHLVRSGRIKPQHIEKTRDYFARFGAQTITIARFVPIVRTIAPFVAGLAAMPGRRFTLFNVFGGLLWCGGFLLAGYWLGAIPWVRGNMRWLTVAIIIVSLLPVFVQWQRAMRENA